MKNLQTTISLLLFVLALNSGCAPKISNPTIDKLEMREQVLKKTRELNSSKLELEKELVTNRELISKVAEINRDASASADDARDRSNKVSRNPGDAGISRKADIASKRAAGDAKKARKLNSDLDDSNGKIKSLQKKIESLETEVNELKSKIEFVPNQPKQ
jgi:predicted  nucleic acid-binding Zn-ribbon protein